MTDATAHELLAREIEVWEALVRGDPDGDAALLAPDFLGVYPTGFADRDGHAGQLRDGPTVASYTIADATTKVITADHVLLVYDARYRRAAGGPEERMYVSSLWSRLDGEWINVFSQDTPAAGPPAASTGA